MESEGREGKRVGGVEAGPQKGKQQHVVAEKTGKGFDFLFFKCKVFWRRE